MTFAKFSMTVLVIYIMYYGILILVERLKTKQNNLSHSSPRVHFVVEQPQNMLSNDQQAVPASEQNEKKSSLTNEASATEEEKDKNILEDLGIEAYYSGSIDITEDNLLTLSNNEVD